LPALSVLYESFPNAPFYMLLDDGTHVVLANLDLVLAPREPDAYKEPLYAGLLRRVAGCRPTWGAEDVVFAHGGSGILLNAAAMRRLYPAIPSCIRQFHDCWGGDIQVSLCLAQVGIALSIPADFQGLFFGSGPTAALVASESTQQPHASQLLPLTFHTTSLAELFRLRRVEVASASEGASLTMNRLDSALHVGSDPPGDK